MKNQAGREEEREIRLTRLTVVKRRGEEVDREEVDGEEGGGGRREVVLALSQAHRKAI